MLAALHSVCVRVSLHLDGERIRVPRHSRPTETRGQQLHSMNTMGAQQSDERPELPQTVNTDLFH